MASKKPAKALPKPKKGVQSEKDKSLAQKQMMRDWILGKKVI